MPKPTRGLLGHLYHDPLWTLYLPVWMLIRMGPGTLRPSHREVAEARIIARSGAFDKRFYRDAYPEASATRLDPIWHYVTIGHLEFRDPRPDFDTRYYIATNPDVPERKINPFVHYLTEGTRLGRHTRSQLTTSRHGATEGNARYEFNLGNIADRTADVAVVLHLFYPDLWPELRGYLNSIAARFDLYISATEHGIQEHTLREIQESFPCAIIKRVANHGRDILPFVGFLNTGRLSAYRYVCKIHTKKSPHISHGDSWRRSMLDDLVGSEQRVNLILRRFDADEKVGIIGPAHSYFVTDPHPTGNIGHIHDLCRVLGVRSCSMPFFGGSMFWFRPAALNPIRALRLSAAAFEPERNQVDGTLAHAIERLFTICADAAGFRVLDTAMLDPAKPLQEK